MSASIAIQDLWKSYRIGRAAPGSLRELLSLAPLRKGQGHRGSTLIWPLREVNLDVTPGEVLGVIGPNGAGKSTLLKILARITAPTRGRVELRGRVASLLEVGTGFHPELTGRENVFLNGAILGMSRREIRQRFDAIVEFAEVAQFVDTPVKRYSSGMYLRLAFAVAAHLEPDILLIDEVLAVGDARFQRKCLGRLRDATAEGRTVLFVSHQMSAISQLARNAIVLSEGRVKAHAPADEAIRVYMREIASTFERPLAQSFAGSLADTVHFSSLTLNGKVRSSELQIAPHEPLAFECVGRVDAPLGAYRTTLEVIRDGLRVVSQHDAPEPAPIAEGEFVSRFSLPAYFLSPGDYSVQLGGYDVATGRWTWGTDLLRLTVLEQWNAQFDTRANMGVVNLTTVGSRCSVEAAVTEDACRPL